VLAAVAHNKLAEGCKYSFGSGAFGPILRPQPVGLVAVSHLLISSVHPDDANSPVELVQIPVDVAVPQRAFSPLRDSWRRPLETFWLERHHVLPAASSALPSEGSLPSLRPDRVVSRDCRADFPLEPVSCQIPLEGESYLWTAPPRSGDERKVHLDIEGASSAQPVVADLPSIAFEPTPRSA